MISPRRLSALCIKESRQIIRDPSSIIIALILPLLLLVIFGYGLNLDATRLNLGLCDEDGGAEARNFCALLAGSGYFDVRRGSHAQLGSLLEAGRIRGYVLLPQDFSRRLEQDTASILVVTDGTEPNTAVFVSNFVRSIWQDWQTGRARDRGESVTAGADIRLRYWFNAAAISRHYLIPGSITVILTVIGAMLTSLVVAREWERGTMEALLASPVTRAELLLSKLIPYYVLGMGSTAVVSLSAVWIMGVPFRGSILALFLVSSAFLFSMLGMGLFISTVMRSQFDSAQASLNAAFLPTVMLSGAFFVISSMPAPVRALTWLLPSRYLVTALQTIFLAGDIWSILLPDILFLTAASVFFIGLTAWKTARHLDGQP